MTWISLINFMICKLRSEWMLHTWRPSEVTVTGEMNPNRFWLSRFWNLKISSTARDPTKKTRFFYVQKAGNMKHRSMWSTTNQQKKAMPSTASTVFEVVSMWIWSHRLGFKQRVGNGVSSHMFFCHLRQWRKESQEKNQDTNRFCLFFFALLTWYSALLVE